MAAAAQAFHEAKLVQRGGAGDDGDPFDPAVQVFIGQSDQLGGGHDLAAVLEQAGFPADGAGGGGVIAGQHDDADAARRHAERRRERSPAAGRGCRGSRGPSNLVGCPSGRFRGR